MSFNQRRAPLTVLSAGSWSNPGNVSLSDGNYATTVVVTSGEWKNFNFSIPTESAILGFEVLIRGIGIASGSTIRVSLSANSVSYSSTHTGTLPFGAVNQDLILGGSADLWGSTWSIVKVDSSSFSIKVENLSSFGGQQTKIDLIQITAYFKAVMVTTTSNVRITETRSHVTFLKRISASNEAVKEQRLRFLALTRRVAETEGLTEPSILNFKGFARVITESEAITEGNIKILTLKRQNNELIDVYEGTIKIGSFVKRISEPNPILENFNSSLFIVKKIGSTVDISEINSNIISRLVAKIIGENQRILELVRFSYVLVHSLIDPVLIKEKIIFPRRIVRLINTIERIAERPLRKLIRQSIRLISETMRLVETPPAGSIKDRFGNIIGSAPIGVIIYRFVAAGVKLIVQFLTSVIALEGILGEEPAFPPTSLVKVINELVLEHEDVISVQLVA